MNASRYANELPIITLLKVLSQHACSVPTPTAGGAIPFGGLCSL